VWPFANSEKPERNQENTKGKKRIDEKKNRLVFRAFFISCLRGGDLEI
jgi:hypothetical protein